MITCPRCATQNPDQARFCTNCGNSLRQTCPNCATENPITAKFCFNCGHALAQAAPTSTPTPTPAATPTLANVIAPTTPVPDPDRIQRSMPDGLRAKLDAARSSHSMEGERRIVTILFCDVRGSTAVAEGMDPEEWTGIMNDIFEYMIQPVYRYEGTIARLMGDAILAFFGAPIAHEDDPQRAVLAGLDIINGFRIFRANLLRTRGLDLDLRVGINTGLVVVGQVGSDMAVEYTVMGDAVNVAARMEQTAQPGTVQIAANTHRIIAPLFDVESLGGIEVKGKREPIPAYRVLQPKAEPGRVRGIEGLDSPLVGRDREYDALIARLDDLPHGQGAIVSVIGDAGLGKSRLVAEARKVASTNANGAAAPTPITWHEGRSLSYQTNTPYAPFVDLLSNLFGLHPEDADSAKMDTIRERVGHYAPGNVDDIVPFLGSMLGLKLTGDDLDRVRYLEPPALRERVFGAVKLLLDRMAVSGPLVIVFEDLHWTDATSLELVERLLPLTEQRPLLIIALFRPQHQDVSWRLHETIQRNYSHRYTPLTLEPLTEAHTRELVRNLLHIEGLPEKVRLLILQKAEGNPFFVEEVIRSLIDSNLVVQDGELWRATREIENIALPDTLAGIITARLDRLDDESKRTVQTASVVGREFDFPVLAEIYELPEELDSALVTLQQRELIREKSRVPRHAYLFKHVLTQETAYGSLLLSRRRTLHRHVAETLQRLEPELVHDIAHHFLEAQAPEQALPFLVKAAHQAAAAYATTEAIADYTQALELLKASSDTDMALARQVYEGLGNALSMRGDIPGVLQTYEEMLNKAIEQGDVSMQVSALNKVGYVSAMMIGDAEKANQHLAESERLAREIGDISGIAEMCTTHCMLRTFAADFEGVIRYMGDSLRLSRESGNLERESQGLEHIASTYVYMADFETALKNADEGMAVARSINDLMHVSALLTFAYPMIHLANGDIDRAYNDAKTGLDMSVRIGAYLNIIFGGHILGDICRMRGHYEEAIAAYQLAVDAAQPIFSFMPFALVFPLAALGTAYFEVGGEYAQQGAEMHKQALAMLDENSGAVPGGAIAWAEIGFCAFALGNRLIAEESFQKGLTTRSVQMNLQRPRHLIGMAAVLTAKGELDEAQYYMDEGRRYVDKNQMAWLNPYVELLEGQIALARGDCAEAAEVLPRAELLATPMGMRPVIWQAQVGTAQALDALGRADEAAVKREQARATIESIAADFSDQRMRVSFLTRALRAVDMASSVG